MLRLRDLEWQLDLDLDRDFDRDLDRLLFRCGFPEPDDLARLLDLDRLSDPGHGLHTDLDFPDFADFDRAFLFLGLFREAADLHDFDRPFLDLDRPFLDLDRPFLDSDFALRLLLRTLGALLHLARRTDACGLFRDLVLRFTDPPLLPGHGLHDADIEALAFLL